jgi:hypothetical protein
MTRVGQSVALAAALAGAGAGVAFASSGEIAPGAYCPIPEPDAEPSCMEPAKQEYSTFFTAIDAGELSDAAAAHLEAEIASGTSGNAPYLAISSLSYGYYRLAQQVAETPGEDPAVVARLQRWNNLLAAAYDGSADDPAYRSAVKDAARDIRDRAPAVGIACADADGNISECDSTEAVIRGFNRTEEAVGLRGALSRLLQRIRGGGGS